MWVGDDGTLYGMNPEFGVFGVAKDTNEKTNPTAIESDRAWAPGRSSPTSPTTTRPSEVWFEGRTPNPPADLDGWLDWKGNPIAEPPAGGGERPLGAPEQPVHHDAAPTCPTSRRTTTTPVGVPIDGIIFGGRTRDREPLIRAITDVAEGVYDGLTLGAEATFAADGLDGQLRYDPMSMRPFMSYPEGQYAAHWLKIIGACTNKPIFAHVNWFQRDADDGHFLWPGYRDNLRALLWLMQLRDGEVKGVQSPVGILPAKDELNADGLEIDPADLDKLLTIDVDRWKQEIGFRQAHLEQFADLPEEIWAAHRRVAKALGDAGRD